MKRKDILLDFTPLLDVTMILLFFFLLFSTFEMEEAKLQLDAQIEAAQEQLAAAEDRMEEANSKYAEADALTEQLKEDLAIVESASERQASSTEELIAFNRSSNIKILLSIEDDIATVRILQGEELLVVTTPDGDLAGIICKALQEAEYTTDDTVLCEFIFDGSEAGTTSAYRKIHENLMYVKGTYHYFYYSETDTSIGKE